MAVLHLLIRVPNDFTPHILIEGLGGSNGPLNHFVIIIGRIIPACAVWGDTFVIKRGVCPPPLSPTYQGIASPPIGYIISRMKDNSWAQPMQPFALHQRLAEELPISACTASMPTLKYTGPCRHRNGMPQCEDFPAVSIF